MTDRDFHALRSHLGLPPAHRTDDFDDDVLAEADRIAALPVSAPTDLTSIPFVTIDPPGSMDLDQAVHLERTDTGFVVHYAIADLGSVIELGGAIDTEARRRGQTIYLPDGRVPLHPPQLSEDALSLLPDEVRRAAVWTIEVGADGALGAATVERATIRSVARLDYAGVQTSIDAGDPHPSVEPLADLGVARRRTRLAAGAIELDLPEQEVVPRDGAWGIRLAPRTAVDGHNAEISLLTGMAAARLMLDGGVGLLRTLPTPDPDDVTAFLDLARSLGVEAPSGATPGQVLDLLDPDRPESMALMTRATRLLRGATYVSFDGASPDDVTHAGIGGPYAHVTAPLRRLVDRFTTEVCLALSSRDRVAADLRAALPSDLRAALPDVVDRMRETDRTAAEADRTAVDLVETWVMHDADDDRRFEAVVMRSADGNRPAEVMLLDPLVVSDCVGDGLVAGERVTVRVASIDDAERLVTYRTV